MTDRWEYSVLQSFWNRREEWITFFGPDGSEQNIGKNSNLERVTFVLSQLGGQGWQLVSTDAEGAEAGFTRRTMWLRHPVQ